MTGILHQVASPGLVKPRTNCDEFLPIFEGLRVQCTVSAATVSAQYQPLSWVHYISRYCECTVSAATEFSALYCAVIQFSVLSATHRTTSDEFNRAVMNWRTVRVLSSHRLYCSALQACTALLGRKRQMCEVLFNLLRWTLLMLWLVFIF